MYKRGSRGLGTGEIIGIIIPIIVAIVLTVLGMLLSILSLVLIVVNIIMWLRGKDERNFEISGALTEN